MPNSEVKKFTDGMKEIENWKKAERKKLKDGKRKHIMYELANHEYCVTYDYEDALNALGMTFCEVKSNDVMYKALLEAKVISAQQREAEPHYPEDFVTARM